MVTEHEGPSLISAVAFVELFAALLNFDCHIERRTEGGGFQGLVNAFRRCTASTSMRAPSSLGQEAHELLPKMLAKNLS